MKSFTLGTYLKEGRIKQGLTKAEVARRLKLESPWPVYQWERDRGSALPLPVLKKLITLYDLEGQVVLDLLLQYQLARLDQKVKNLMNRRIK